LDTTRYLTLDEVVAIHDEIVRRMGSSGCPLLDPRRLDGALTRPRNAAYYAGADLIRQAVVLAVMISQFQAFQGGNKRAAFASARLFLAVNGLVFGGDSMELARWIERVAEVTDTVERLNMVDRFDAWLRGHVAPRPDQP
jgi:death-on-curing family protein